MPIGSAIDLNDQLRLGDQAPASESEQTIARKLKYARARVMSMLLHPYWGNSDASQDCFDHDYRYWEETEAKLQTALALAVAARECEECLDGHLHDCEALDPCEDLMDVLWRHPCEGCCPNGCRERGLQLLATVTGRKFSKMLGVIR